MTLIVVGAATALAFVPGLAFGRGWAQMVLFGTLNMEPTSLDIPATASAVVIATGIGLPLLVALGPIVGASRTTVREALGAAGTERGARPAGRFDAWLNGIRGFDRILLMGFRNIFRRRARLFLSVGMLATAGAIFVAGLNALAGVQAIPQGLMANRRWDVEVALAEPRLGDEAGGDRGAGPRRERSRDLERPDDGRAVSRADHRHARVP
jgi:putative ABC transport system permease protein